MAQRRSRCRQQHGGLSASNSFLSIGVIHFPFQCFASDPRHCARSVHLPQLDPAVDGQPVTLSISVDGIYSQLDPAYAGRKIDQQVHVRFICFSKAYAHLPVSWLKSCINEYGLACLCELIPGTLGETAFGAMSGKPLDSTLERSEGYLCGEQTDDN